MGGPLDVNVQETDGAYEAIADVVRSNVSIFRGPFKAETTPVGEAILNEFMDQADRFCERCSYEAAKIMRQYTTIPEIRGLPTASLAQEIRRDVFEELDRPVQGLKTFRDQLDNLDASLKGGVIDEPDRYRQGTALLRESRTLITTSIGEYLSKVSNIAEQLLDYCSARCYGGEVSLELQQAAIESAQAAIQQELGPIIQSIQARNVEVTDWRNDFASPRLWITFFAAIGVVAVLLILLGLLFN